MIQFVKGCFFGSLIVTTTIALDIGISLNEKMNDLLSSLKNHNVVTPIVIDESRNFLSYDVRQPAKLQDNLYIYYKLTNRDKDYYFNLTKNRKLITGNYIKEIWNGNERTVVEDSESRDCHYHGVVNDDDESFVALSICQGLQGMFLIDNQEYLIEPWWNHTNDIQVNGYPHIIYERSSLKRVCNLSNCGMRNSILKKKQRNIRRIRRSTSIERFVETLVVADEKMVEYHGKETESYVLCIMNIVSKLYRDASLGNAVNIVITRLILLTDEQPFLNVTHHAGKTLNAFCNWQRKLKENSTKYDTAVLITRFDICFDRDEPCDTLGLAQVLGMCEPSRSCSITEDIGLASGLIVAHEMGHNFGMQHDGNGNDCATDNIGKGNIMTSKLSQLSHPIIWSNCSRQYMTDFLNSGQADCLLNKPPIQEYDYQEELPGFQYNAEEQCKSQYGSDSVPCHKHYKTACRFLWCTNSKGKCITNKIPVLDGTDCNVNETVDGFCYEGECMPNNTKFESIDGNWSEWTNWSSCSRTCGGGIEASRRYCNDPSPMYGGKYCIGERIRYRSCNILDCPIDSKDFRDVQCSKFNSIPFRGKFYEWTPYPDVQAKSCSLYCQATGYDFYVERATKVIDGTKCSHSMNVCIDGQCKHVGCDRILGSEASEDKCRVCKGDGSTCKTNRGEYNDASDGKLGEYVEIIKVPKNSVWIFVSEKRPSANFLAVKTVEGKVLINGKSIIHWPKTFTVAGTKFHYMRPKYHLEYIHALGPISEDIIFTLLLQEPNKGIRYVFNVPTDSVGEGISYRWTHLPWSECSKTCAKGISIAKTACVQENNKLHVEEKFCRGYKPSDRSRYCNTDLCPPKWKAFSWNICSKSCGGGHKTRNVFCVQEVEESEEKIVNENLCVGEKPKNSTSCNEQLCPNIWYTSRWSKCRPCGLNRRNRTVVCMNNNMTKKLLPSDCPGEIPATTSECPKSVCPSSRWFKSSWGKCNVTCGHGFQMRIVECRTWKGKSSDQCLESTKPSNSRTCFIPCKKEECTDANKVGYCQLVVKLQFCVRHYFSKMCCKSCSQEKVEYNL